MEERESTIQEEQKRFSLPVELKSKAIAALLAILIPGTGHLYLGLMKRGIFVMLALAINIAAIPFTVFTLVRGIGETFIPVVVVLGLLIPIQYFYNIFDALQKTDLVNRRILRQEYMLEEDFDDVPVQIRPKTIGIGLLVIGFLLLLRELFPGVIATIFQNGGVILVALALIGGGGYMIYREWQKGK